MLGVPPRPQDTRTLEQNVRDIETLLRRRNAAHHPCNLTPTQAAQQGTEEATQQLAMRLDAKDDADATRRGSRGSLRGLHAVFAAPPAALLAIRDFLAGFVDFDRRNLDL